MNGKELSRALRFWAGRGLISALTALPPAAGRRVARVCGWLGWLAVVRDRRLARRNLRSAYPEAAPGELEKRARRVFQELGQNLYDVAAWPRWTPEYRRRQLLLEGADHLRQAQKLGRGVLLLAAHQGAWELLPVALAEAGFSIEAVARPIREPRLERWLTAHRRALGVRTIPRGALAGSRAARAVLARGDVLGILLDHRVKRGGEWVEFFGRPARFVAGPLRLAWRCGAAVVPAQIVRESDGRHQVRLWPPIEWPAAVAAEGSEGRGRIVTEMLKRSVAELERMIRLAPEQWAWIHPRWEDPPGRPKVLAAALPAVAGARPAGRLLAVALLVAALAAAAGCGTPKSPSVATPRKPDGGPEAVTYGFTTRETFDGRLRWVLVADSARTWEDKGQTVLSNLRVEFYDEAQAVYSVLTSDEGAVYRSTNNVAASGNVKVITVDGDTLTTENLAWQNAAGRVKTDDPFRLARPDGVLHGTGFESDPGLKNYTTKDVTIDAH